MTRLSSLSRRQVATVILVVIAVSGPAVGVLGSTLAPSLDNSVDVQGGVPLSAPNGPTVSVDANAEMNLTNPFPTSSSVRITSSVGNATFSGGGTVTATTLDQNVNLVNMSLGASTLTVNPTTLPQYELSGGFSAFDYGEINVDDGTREFSYSASATSTVTIHGVAANTDYKLVDGSGTVLSKGEASSSGTYTATVPSGSKSVRLQTATLNAPEITDVRPINRIDSLPDKIYANISDPDFPTDTVNTTATIILENGSRRVIGTDTASSNGDVVSFNVTSSDKQFIAVGENTLEITAEDSNGITATVRKPFGVPSEIRFHNTSDPTKLLASTVNATFYGGANNNTVVSRTVSNGTLNLSGLPVTSGFTIAVDAQGYNGRAVKLQSIYEQQDIYLLSENATSVEVRFAIEDSTGEWPSDSTLYVERPITINGSTTFQTVVSDSFSVEGVTTDLEEGVRYQLRVKSPDGDTAALGSYTAQVSETVTIRPNAPGVTLKADNQVAYDAYLDNGALQIEYVDADELTEELTVKIYERGNESNTLRPTQTYYDLGNLSLSEPLNNETGPWIVEMTGNRGGETVSIRLTTSGRQDNLVPNLAPVWRLAAGAFILLVSAGIFSQLNVAAGAVVVAVEGGVLWWFGFLNGAATGASVALAICSAVVFNIASRR